MRQHSSALNSRSARFVALGLTVVLGLLVTVISAVAVTPAPTTATPAADIVQSVFVTDPLIVKDPFFPRSTRWNKKPVADERPVPLNLSDDLILKGLSGTSEKRLAIINNYTFQAGEEISLKVAGASVKVRCVEIREKTVVVSVNGITKELRLRRNL